MFFFPLLRYIIYLKKDARSKTASLLLFTIWWHSSSFSRPKSELHAQSHGGTKAAAPTEQRLLSGRSQSLYPYCYTPVYCFSLNWYHFCKSLLGFYLEFQIQFKSKNASSATTTHQDEWEASFNYYITDQDLFSKWPMISVILMVSDITIILIFNQKPLIIHFFIAWFMLIIWKLTSFKHTSVVRKQSSYINAHLRDLMMTKTQQWITVPTKQPD